MQLHRSFPRLVHGALRASLLGLPIACASAYDHMGTGATSTHVAPTESSDVEVHAAAPLGWASVDALGQNGTTGGGDAAIVSVNTLAELSTALAGTDPRVVELASSVEGRIKIGSNKTLQGAPGVVFKGHIGVGAATNVIVRNLTIVGYNCTDNTVCEDGSDAVTIDNGSHHVWFDHCDISDGSDGNLDIAGAADYVTISWTKFSYTGSRPGGHEFSNLIGSSDSSSSDRGHLRVTFHHDHWADNVNQRMPRVRFGQVHLFNNLYTPQGSSYCVGVGVSANILTENTVFEGVKEPINTTDFDNPESVSFAYGNLYIGGSPAAPNLGTNVFVPPYPYTVQPANEVREIVLANAGNR